MQLTFEDGFHVVAWWSVCQRVHNETLVLLQAFCGESRVASGFLPAWAVCQWRLVRVRWVATTGLAVTLPQTVSMLHCLNTLFIYDIHWRISTFCNHCPGYYVQWLSLWISSTVFCGCHNRHLNEHTPDSLHLRTVCNMWLLTVEKYVKTIKNLMMRVLHTGLSYSSATARYSSTSAVVLKWLKIRIWHGINTFAQEVLLSLSSASDFGKFSCI